MRTFIVSIFLIAIMAVLSNCSNESPQPSGQFNVTLSGGLSDQLQGEARFELVPVSPNGRIIITLRESESAYIRLTFVNPDPNQIFLEPDSYNVVSQLGQDVLKEVLVDFVSQVGTFTATSGEIRVGIVKNSQIKGDLVNVLFSTLNITSNGTFDAIPE